MKSLLVFFGLLFAGLAVFAQDIEVDNYISAKFEIKATYSDGSTTDENTITIYANAQNTVLLYTYPAFSNFDLISFKVYTVDCTPTLSLECTYGNDNVGDISECGRCGTGWTGEAIYTAGSDYVGLRCYQ